MWWNLFWILSLILSFLCLALDVAGSWFVSIRAKKNHNYFNWLFAGVAVATFLTFLPLHSATEAVWGGPLGILFLSGFNVIQVFTAGCDFGFFAENMVNCPSWLISWYQVWTAFLYFLAPLFTFGFILSLFKNVFAYIRYYWYVFIWKRPAYVFSELNEKAFALANDIKNNHSDAVIAFTDIFNEDEEKMYELLERTKEIASINFKKDILAIDFENIKVFNKSLWTTKASINFFTIGENETENLNQSLKLIEMYKHRQNTQELTDEEKKDEATENNRENEPNTFMYVFSTRIESEILLNSLDKGNMKVRRINEVQSLVNRFLLEKGNLLFDSARENADKTKDISVIMVGMGNHGTEFTKALTWYGQMDGYRIKINVFDKDPLAEEKFTALAPELMSDEYNGVYIDGEAQYDITIHSGIDVHTQKFAEEIQRIDDATFVIVALGNDDANINTAVNMRMYFERMKIHPIIHSIIYNSQQKKALEGIKNFDNQEYKIEFFGDNESSFTEAVIINSELEDEALEIHKEWGPEESFWNYEYNYRSSVASALHKNARSHCGITFAYKKEEDLTKEENDVIGALEHRRWNAYMRAEGYVYSGSKKKESRNDLAKMHHSLVEYSSLSEEDKKKDSKIGTK